VNARDRIGKGPWRNAKGEVVATSVDDLHSANNKLGKQTSLTEKGTKPNYLAMVDGKPAPTAQPLQHDILTGTNEDVLAGVARLARGNAKAEEGVDRLAQVLAGARFEPAIAADNSPAAVQFERQGYFARDPDSAPGKPVFNRTVTLKDSWAKIQKRS